MVFINPSSEYIGGETISCNESYHGYYSYICFANIVYQYPSFNGYLLINDDDYMKPWELENLDFHIPFIFFKSYSNKLEIISSSFHHDLFAIEDVNAFLRRSGGEFDALEGVPSLLREFPSREVDACRVVGRANHGIGLIFEHLCRGGDDIPLALDGKPYGARTVSADAHIEDTFVVGHESLAAEFTLGEGQEPVALHQVDSIGDGRQ